MLERSGVGVAVTRAHALAQRDSFVVLPTARTLARYMLQNRVQKLHHLMTLLVVFKLLSLMFEAIMYHFIAVTGRSTGWNIVFYILTFLRGVLLIVVIALIGAGWSLLRSFLSPREKKVIMIALPLQVLANVAIIVVDELDPGSKSFAAASS
ncbi:hypothetical protein EON66_07345, partial [archaeon]